MRSALFFLLFTAACGGSSKNATSVISAEQERSAADEESVTPASQTDYKGTNLTPQELDLVTGLEIEMSRFAKVVAGSGEDCGELAKAVNEYVDKNGESLRRLSSRVDETTPEKKDALDQELLTRLGPRVESVVPVLLSCKDHEGVTRALGRMETL